MVRGLPGCEGGGFDRKETPVPHDLGKSVKIGRGAAGGEVAESAGVGGKEEEKLARHSRAVGRVQAA